MFTYDSTVHWSYVNIGNWFLLWSTDFYTRSDQNLIVHKPSNHVLCILPLEKKVASHLAIVADWQYFSLVHISSLLLQLIGSYGQDWPVYQTVLQETPLGIALFSQAQYLIWMFQECQSFPLVPELALHERFVEFCMLNIIFRYICCDNWKCDAALLFLPSTQHD
jgi:hypothetical protein